MSPMRAKSSFATFRANQALLQDLHGRLSTDSDTNAHGITFTHSLGVVDVFQKGSIIARWTCAQQLLHLRFRGDRQSARKCGTIDDAVAFMREVLADVDNDA